VEGAKLKRTVPRLRREPPPGRTAEQLRNHYEVEKAIALRLRDATREERKAIYASMYDELLAKVPDHPRLGAAASAEALEGHNRSKLKLVEQHLGSSIVFVEFAPGDCTFAHLVCRHAKVVHGVDISDQSARGAAASGAPSNFTPHTYDGYELDLPDGFADVVFSDQLIEHLHPEDAGLHFDLAARILRPGGVYILRTPHAFYGPSDISGYFSDTPEGFHLKEWTYTELNGALARAGYSTRRGIRRFRGRYRALPIGLFTSFEGLVGGLPGVLRRSVARLFLPRHLCMWAIK
jgi:SAM-dependent methyltransferase